VAVVRCCTDVKENAFKRLAVGEVTPKVTQCNPIWRYIGHVGYHFLLNDM